MSEVEMPVITFCNKGFGYRRDNGFGEYYADINHKVQFIGRKKQSFIKNLDIQYYGSYEWNVFWNHSSVKDEKLFKSFLHPYPDLLFCQSWKIPRKVRRIRIKNITMNTHDIYIHSKDSFSVMSMRATVPKFRDSGEYTLNLDIEMTSALTTNDNYCETNEIFYPDNLKSGTLAKLMKENGHCVTPFLENQETTCKTEKSARKSLFKIKKTQDNKIYPLPCNILQANVYLESVRKYKARSFRSKNMIINLPSVVPTTTSVKAYTFISYAAELGNWLGLFTGICLIQVHK